MINITILKLLDNLTSNKGNSKTAQKVPDEERSITELSHKEKKMDRSNSKDFLWRIGELPNIKKVKFIDINDLPKI